MFHDKHFLASFVHMRSRESNCTTKSVHFSVVYCFLQHIMRAVAMPTTTLLSLPPEILHKVLDHLDAQTILLSVKCVCMQLHAIVGTYNRFRLKLASHRRLVNINQDFPTENVISLTIYDDWDSSEIEDFERKHVSSLIHNLRRFTQLRSLTLYGIYDDELGLLLSYFITTNLINLTIDLQIWSRSSSLLQSSSSMMQPLQYVSTFDNLERTFSSTQYVLQHLSLCFCTIWQLSYILHHFPHLRTLNVSCMVKNDRDQMNMIPLIPMIQPKLESLNLNCSMVQKSELESLLLCMPFLCQLELCGRSASVDFLFDGSYWKQLIVKRLPRLQEFKFWFCTPSFNEDDEIESIINTFQTPFWFEEKHWLVSCTFRAYFPQCRMILQSPPISITDFNHTDEGYTFSLFNQSSSINERITINTVRRVKLCLTAMLNCVARTQVRILH